MGVPVALAGAAAGARRQPRVRGAFVTLAAVAGAAPVAVLLLPDLPPPRAALAVGLAAAIGSLVRSLLTPAAPVATHRPDDAQAHAEPGPDLSPAPVAAEPPAPVGAVVGADPVPVVPKPVWDDYRVLFESHPTPMWVVDDESLRFLAVNEAVVQRYGYSREEFLALTVRDVTPAGDIDRLIQTSGDAAAPADTLPWRHRTSSGVLLSTDVLACRLPVGDRPVRLIVAGDWTNMRRAQEELRDREAFLRSLLAHIPCGVFWKDRASIYLGCNEQVARDRGLTSPGEVVGLTDCELSPAPEEADDGRAKDWQVLGSGAALHNTEEVRTGRDGVKSTLLVSRVPMKDESGEVIGVLGVYKDITDRKRLEDQLRQSQKMEAIGRLAGGVAHDFNNLLTIIIGNAHLVRALPPGDEGLPALMDDIHEAADRAAVLTRQLLTFGRKQQAKLEVIDLNDTLTAISGLLRRLIGEPIKVRATLSPTPVRIRADKSQIEQVVMNLAVNARDAMPRGGTLSLTTAEVTAPGAGGTPPARFARLTVTDTGEGMTEEIKAKIFEPFFTTKEVGKGTGLGLATVYGIVEQAGGTVEVDSTPRVGTTFRIQFPCCEAAAAPQAHASHSSLPAVKTGTGRSVLLVEDEEGIRRLARSTLLGQGYNVIDAERGEVALELLARVRGIDLLITDLVMPGMDGRELATRVRALRPEVGVVFISGYAPDNRKFADLPGALLLPKPFTPEDLAKVALRVLRRGRGGHEPGEVHVRVG
ncbi:pas pac sensor hybrid histidine kinase : PAS/PAC sensor hybrid histidine kinase OS=Geobacter sp. (strain M21) GN=GM21_3966 PE=4 SV=1: PAS_8: PAS_4: HisKA: HATPase_c: Response_reg [Gemmataceae bacterium]|nr:pas pac sensor hybrid histidine kinase : PAS/PAC sensor hybrid histidine kinase OS=Geobacter sp. (strain M21) GN=GM21_3966 PE=4 SV=1: PAS_8: PAS_4: HisKA: HATPase_c: Response_reg [Gemmataceae bacterium]VTT97888.1 pas pac sensor hybrid histidine kinase : PAS/PAC sensor hybrid histidine kinase OS=Geobacter sp. (strain M21) GN=GM21_3966 PE=4 SV=1: PAS_8: PAS_4: HisKA: HATPase_c: Response_reg [Gemmataceae bacterium]